MENPKPGDNRDEVIQIKSRNSIHPSPVRFVNMTSRRVDLIWIDYAGGRVKYSTLEPRADYDINTFVTHPWIFLDSETHTKLVVDSKEVFEPLPVPENDDAHAPEPIRAYVNIRLPVYTLKECSLQRIQKCLRDPKDALELEIPAVLQKNLHERCSLNFDILAAA